MNVLAQCEELGPEILSDLRPVEWRALFNLFEECAEAGSFGWKKQNEAQAKGTA